MQIICSVSPLTITPLGYGPTPLHTDQGEQAFFSFRVDSTDPTATYTDVIVSVDIHGALGNIVRTLSTSGSIRLGIPISLAWDGKDAAGKLVPPGDYAPTFKVNAKSYSCMPGTPVASSAIFCSGMTILPPRRKPPNNDGGDNNTSNDNNNNNLSQGGGGGGGGGGGSDPSSTSNSDLNYNMFTAKLPDDTTDPCSDTSTDPTPISPGSSEMYNFTTDANGNITLNLLNGFDMSHPIQSLDLGNGFSLPGFRLPGFNLPTLNVADLYNGFLWPSINFPNFNLPTTLDITNGFTIPTL